MNEIQIFSNADFGEIRTVVDDDGVWFVAKDISDRLGYVKTSNMNKLIDDDDRKVIGGKGGSKMEHPLLKGNITQIGLINESGLYAAIFGSTLPNAKKFKRWVTSEVLPSIRRTGGYTVADVPQTTSGQIQLLAQGFGELEKRVDNLDVDVGTFKSELETLKNDLPILPIEQEKITEAVRRKGTEVLGGKQSPAYTNRGLRQKLYNNLYSNLKYNFGVRSYRAIKRKECDTAVEIVRNYKPPYFLQSEIDNENAQMTMAV